MAHGGAPLEACVLRLVELVPCSVLCTVVAATRKKIEDTFRAKEWEGRLWRIKTRELNDRKIVRMSVMTVLNPTKDVNASTAPCRAYIGGIGFHIGSPPNPPMTGPDPPGPGPGPRPLPAPELRQSGGGISAPR